MWPLSALDTTTFRRCSKCKCWKPQTYQFFYIHKSGKIESWCRRCSTLQSREYAKKNREKIRAYYREWKEANRERVNALSRKWWEANKEKHKATVRNWSKRNKDKEATTTRNYLARRRAAEGTHSHQEILDMYDDQQGLCAYCEIPLFGAYHVDHMLPLTRGGSNSWDNLAIVCPTCNISKFTKTTEEFFNT